MGAIEALEGRRLLSAVAWTGAAGDDQWTTPANWSINAVPGPADDVTVNVVGNPTIQLTSGSQSIRSLAISDPLAISGASLAVAATAHFSGMITLTDGTLVGGTYVASGAGALAVAGSGSSTLDGVILNGNVTIAGTYLTVLNGLTLNGIITMAPAGGSTNNSGLTFQGTQTFSGAGQVIFANPNGSAVDASGDGTQPGAATLTIGPTITIHGTAGVSAQAFVEGNFPFDQIVNQGTINADQPGLTIDVTSQNAGVANSGDITASSAGAVINIIAATFTNTGNDQGANGGVVNVSVGVLSFTGGNVIVTGTFSAQSVSISGGDVAFDSASPVMIQSLNLSGGMLDGSAPVTLTGKATLSGGSLVGTGITTLAPMASLNVAGQVTATRMLVNAGTINVASGMLELDGGGSQTGSFVLAQGATLAFGGTGAQDLAAGSSLSGNGAVQFASGAQATLGGTYNVGATAIADQATVMVATSAATGQLAISGGALVIGKAAQSPGLRPSNFSLTPAAAPADILTVLTQTVFNGGTTTILAGAALSNAAGLIFTGGNPLIDLLASDSTPGAIQLGGDVNFAAASGSATIQSTGSGAHLGQIDLGGALRTFTINKTGAVAELSIAADVLDGSLRKDGPGLLRLAAPSAYAGGTADGAGTLEVDDPNALGAGLLTLAGGTLSARTGGTPLPNSILVDAASTASVDVDNTAMQLTIGALGAALNVSGLTGGSLLLNGAVTLQNNLTIDNSVPVTIGGAVGGSHGVTFAGTSTITLSGPSANTWTGPTEVESGTLVLDKTSALAVPSSLLIDGRGQVRLQQSNQLPATALITFDNTVGPAGLSLNANTQTLAGLNGAAGGRIDLGQGSLRLAYGAGADPDAMIRSLVITGRNGNSGIFSSTLLAGQAVGYADNPAVRVELVKSTPIGDANLDGKVDATDFAILAANQGKSGTGWSTADFNDDGITDQADYQLVAQFVKVPTVSSFVINDGSAQRSMVSSLMLRFNEPVTLAGGAISLATATGTLIPLHVSTSDEQTYVLSFNSSQVVSGSLPDGRYLLTMHANMATDLGGAPLYVDETYSFFRLFGDFDGNGIINNADYFQFSKGFGKKRGDVAFMPLFDFNGDAIINNADYFQFNRRFGMRL